MGPTSRRNDLDPLLELYDPAGTLVASNNNWPVEDGGDGRNSRIVYTVPEGSGGDLPSARLRRSLGSGDYTLEVAGATGDHVVPLVVTDASIADGTSLTSWPGTIQLDFSSPLLLTSVQAADLTVNGIAADSVTVVDGDTLQFDITGRRRAMGRTRSCLAANAMQNLTGRDNAAFSLAFHAGHDFARGHGTSNIAAGGVDRTGQSDLHRHFQRGFGDHRAGAGGRDAGRERASA